MLPLIIAGIILIEFIGITIWELRQTAKNIQSFEAHKDKTLQQIAELQEVIDRGNPQTEE